MDLEERSVVTQCRYLHIRAGLYYTWYIWLVLVCLSLLRTRLTWAASRTHLVVQSTDVKGRVPRGVLGAHVCSVEQQMLQMLHMAVAAGLRIWTHGLSKSDSNTRRAHCLTTLENSRFILSHVITVHPKVSIFTVPLANLKRTRFVASGEKVFMRPIVDLCLNYSSKKTL